MRKAVNILQTASILNKEAITKEAVLSSTSRADPKQAESLVSSALEGRYSESRKILAGLLFDQGLGAEDILKEVHSALNKLDIPEDKRFRMLEKLGDYEFRIAEGSSARIQLEAMLASFSIIAKQ